MLFLRLLRHTHRLSRHALSASGWLGSVHSKFGSASAKALATRSLAFKISVLCFDVHSKKVLSLFDLRIHLIRKFLNPYFLMAEGLKFLGEGNNGTIDGMGMIWWEWFSSHSLNHSHPHLVELIASDYMVVSNLTILNAPAFTIHAVYCSNVHIQNISISTPPESPYTVGIVPDSSDNVCIEDCIIAMGFDAISLKSGWDEYGIAYGRPTENVHIRRVHLNAFSGSAIAFGSYMSGGISNVQVEHVHLFNSNSGIEFRTAKGRGGYMKEIVISDIQMENIYTAIAATGHCESHPDDKFDPNALPILDHITLKDVTGTNITIAGSFAGIEESPFTNICLSNITLSTNSVSPFTWECSNVSGFSESVIPQPCPQLGNPSNSSSSCFDLLSISGKTAEL